MRAIDLLKERVDARFLLEVYGASPRGYGKMLRSHCPIHGGDNPTAFVYDQENHLYYCFTGCSEGGDIFDFVMKIEKCSFRSAIIKVANMFSFPLDDLDALISQAESDSRSRKMSWLSYYRSKARRKELPEYTPENGKYLKVTKYRGFSNNCLEHFRLVKAETGELKDRIVFPILDAQKRLVGVSGRRIKNDPSIPKFMHRPRNLETGSVLTGLGLNLPHVREKNQLVIVEGIFDVMRCWDVGIKNVATPIGTFTTERHVELALKSGAFNVVIGFDNDRAGRNGVRKALKMYRYKAQVEILNLPDGKDPCDCSPDELLFAYNNRLSAHEWANRYGLQKESV